MNILLIQVCKKNRSYKYKWSIQYYLQLSIVKLFICEHFNTKLTVLSDKDDKGPK